MLKASDLQRTGGRGAYRGPIFKLQMLDLIGAESKDLVLLTPKFFDVEVHWYGKMHVACTLPSGYCLPCSKGNPTRPLYYGFAQVVKTKQVVCLKLTPHMVASEPELSRVQSLRGVQVRYYRWKNCPNGRPCIEVTGTVFDVSVLPTAPDIESFVLKMYSKIIEKRLEGS